MLPPRIRAPPRERWSRCLGVTSKIHDLTAQHLKSLRRKRFRKEISIVVLSVHQWNNDLLRLNHVSNEEMSARDVLRTPMMFRIVGEIARSLVVCSKDSRSVRQCRY